MCFHTGSGVAHRDREMDCCGILVGNEKMFSTFAGSKPCSPMVWTRSYTTGVVLIAILTLRDGTVIGTYPFLLSWYLDALNLLDMSLPCHDGESNNVPWLVAPLVGWPCSRGEGVHGTRRLFPWSFIGQILLDAGCRLFVLGTRFLEAISVRNSPSPVGVEPHRSDRYSSMRLLI